MASVPDTGGGFTTAVPTSADLNSKLVDPVNFLLTPPMLRARQTSLQTVSTSTFTAVTFTTEDVDNANEHSTSVATSRYTAAYPGWRGVGGGVGFAANATGRRLSAWYVNGTILNGSQIALPATAANDAQVPARAMKVFLNVGDYLELFCYQESGGNLNTFVTTGGQSTMDVVWESN